MIIAEVRVNYKWRRDDRNVLERRGVDPVPNFPKRRSTAISRKSGAEECHNRTQMELFPAPSNFTTNLIRIELLFWASYR